MPLSEEGMTVECLVGTLLTLLSELMGVYSVSNSRVYKFIYNDYTVFTDH